MRKRDAQHELKNYTKMSYRICEHPKPCPPPCRVADLAQSQADAKGEGQASRHRA